MMGGEDIEFTSPVHTDFGLLQNEASSKNDTKTIVKRRSRCCLCFNLNYIQQLLSLFNGKRLTEFNFLNGPLVIYTLSATRYLHVECQKMFARSTTKCGKEIVRQNDDKQHKAPKQNFLLVSP